MKLKSILLGETLSETALTWGLFASIAYALKVIAADGSLLLFLPFMVAAPVISKTVNFLSRKFCYFLQNNLFVGKPNEHVLDKKTRLIKLEDQFWQLVQHIISTALLYPCVMSFDGWSHPEDCFNPPPHTTIPTLLAKCCYCWELAAYIFNGVAHRYWNIRKTDYIIMFGHHIATITLLAGSYSYKWWKFGCCVMFFHDFSDIPVDSLIIINMLKLEEKTYFFLTEIQYCITTISWFVIRNCLYPMKMLYPVYIFNKCDECFPDGKIMFYFLWLLLHVLYAMHIYWLFVFLRIGYRLVFTTAAEDVYEKEEDKTKKDSSTQAATAKSE